MPARQPNFGWAPRAALLAALLPLLAECGPARNQFAPPCPRQAILGDAADLDVYRGSSTAGAGRDLTDLVLHGRIIGMQGSCKPGDHKDQLAVTVNVGVELTRGPAMPGREADVPVFIAVTEGDTILDKRVYLMHVVFPSNVDRVTLSRRAQSNLVLPVTPDEIRRGLHLLAGFQLTPDQMTQTAATGLRDADRSSPVAVDRVQDGELHVARLRLQRAQHGLQPAAQLVDLVEQRQHQRHGILADVHVAPQVVDQPHACDVDLAEHQRRVLRCPGSPSPARPSVSAPPVVQIGEQRGDRCDVHHSVSMPARGSIGWRGFQVFRNSASSGSSAGGSTGCSSTN